MAERSFRQQLEEHNNPEEVRQRLAAGNYNLVHARIAQEYLDSLERKEAAESAVKRDIREEETLSIAREANRIASRAERWAMYAAIAAIIALIISIARSST